MSFLPPFLAGDMTAYLRAAANVLVHVPDLVRYGSKPWRETSRRDQAPGDVFADLRSFDEVVGYAPNQAFIGNLRAREFRRNSNSVVREIPSQALRLRANLGKSSRRILSTPLLRRPINSGWYCLMRSVMGRAPWVLIPRLRFSKEKNPLRNIIREIFLGRIERGEALPLFQNKGTHRMHSPRS